MAGEWAILASLLAFAFAARVLMALTVPLWQGPDEPKHFEYARVLIDGRAQLWQERRFPDAGDASLAFEADVMASMVAHRYWEYLRQQPPTVLPASFVELWGPAGTALHGKSALAPLYYLLEAAVLFPAQEADLERQVLIARLLSVLLSTLTVAVTYLAAREVAPHDRFVPLVSAMFVAALPMHAFIGGVVNNDNLVALMGSVVALGLAAGFRRGFVFKRWLAIGLALTLALVTKRTAVGLLPAVLLTGAFWLASLRGRYRQLAVAGLVLVLASTAIAFASGLVSRAVDRFGLSQMAINYALNNPDHFTDLLRVPFWSPEVREMAAVNLSWLFRSFWGTFGWFRLPLSAQLYQLLTVATLICALGFLGWLIVQVRAQIKQPGKERAAQIGVVVVYAVAIGSMIALSLGERLAFLTPGEIPQGRYLFVVVAPIAVIYALGARAVLPARFLGTRLPGVLCIVLLAALDIAVYTGYIVPFYIKQVFA